MSDGVAARLASGSTVTVFMGPKVSATRQREPKERGELLDSSPQLQDLLSELAVREVRHIQAHHDRRRRAQPAARR